ncbi:MAG TPA: peptidoglycan-binding protein [Candidatus Limiplasma sp.]|nr:peptidoglycan-binding protein [Candidatus Limiplasma sp.]
MKRFLALVLSLALALSVSAQLSSPSAVAESGDAGYTPTQYGDSGDSVAAIQEQLKALGYYTGKVSGNFLDGTRAAVKKFQADYSLKETGIVDGETEALLMNAEYRELTTNDSGDDVKRLQEELQTLGYYNGKLSGNYLEGTTAAIKSFQEKNNLKSTGTADIETQRLLFSSTALSKDAPQATATSAPGSDLGDINDVVMASDGDKDKAPTDVEYTKKLSRGSTGDQVKLVQQRLTDLGYFSGPISGNYMNKTQDAVKQFQQNNGLKADGVTGEDTWNILFDDTQALNASASPRPTPEPTPIPYAITVDVNNQITTVYGRDDKGGYTIPVRQMVCSTGMVATPSDVGVWTLNGKKARWCFFSKYGSYAQYWTRINAYIAFHSVIYNQVDYNAMSKKSYNLLGSRASHGCIRLLNADAKWIYDNVGEGVQVTITEDLPADPELRYALKPAPLAKGSITPITTPEPTATPAYSSNGMPPQPFRTLKKGSSGEDVFWLQMKLKELGFYNGGVTGTFLAGTQKAVKAYQKANGIYSTGEANENTLQSIYADVLNPATPSPTAVPSPTETPAPTPSPSATPTPKPTVSPTPTSKPAAHSTVTTSSSSSAKPAATATK